MRVSVTEIEAFQLCEKKHSYQYGLRLQANAPEATSIALRIGRTVAESIEVGLGLGAGTDAKRKALDYVGTQIEDDKDLGKALICVEKMPDFIWDIKLPISEDKLEVPYWDDVVVGIPDLWWVEYDEDKIPLAVHVEEFKTGYQSGSKASERLVAYEKWGIQASRYAVLLRDKYPWLHDIPMYRRHILLSYAGRGKAYVGRDILVSEATLDQTRMEMLSLVDRIAALEVPTHHFGRLCDWCQYAPICWTYLTGGDESDTIKWGFTKKQK